jgi:hypothetical protein
MNETYFVTLDLNGTAAAIYDAIVGGSITGELIDSYTIESQSGACIVQVFEKHYWRAGNRLTLTAVTDNLSGITRVHCISGGGGEGLFRFDWGAADSFTGAVSNALQPYMINR